MGETAYLVFQHRKLIQLIIIFNLLICIIYICFRELHEHGSLGGGISNVNKCEQFDVQDAKKSYTSSDNTVNIFICNSADVQVSVELNSSIHEGYQLVENKRNNPVSLFKLV